jgi:hypothetical protein
MPVKQKAPAPGKRIMLGLRVAPDVKQELDAAATRSGRSQSQEAEIRLVASLQGDVLIRAMTSPQVRPVFDYLTDLLNLKIDVTPETVDAIVEGAALIFRAISAGGISEERVRQLWLEDLPRHKNQRAADALVAAFNVLTTARLAPPLDPQKMLRWLQGGDAARDRADTSLPLRERHVSSTEGGKIDAR